MIFDLPQNLTERFKKIDAILYKARDKAPIFIAPEYSNEPMMVYTFGEYWRPIKSTMDADYDYVDKNLYTKYSYVDTTVLKDLCQLPLDNMNYPEYPEIWIKEINIFNKRSWRIYATDAAKENFLKYYKKDSALVFTRFKDVNEFLNHIEYKETIIEKENYNMFKYGDTVKFLEDSELGADIEYFSGDNISKFRENFIWERIIGNSEEYALDPEIKDTIDRVRSIKNIDTKYSCSGHPYGIFKNNKEYYLVFDMISSYVNFNTDVETAKSISDRFLTYDNKDIPLFSDLVLEMVSKEKGEKQYLVDLMDQNTEGGMELVILTKELINTRMLVDTELEVRTAIEYSRGLHDRNKEHYNRVFNVTIRAGVNGLYCVKLRDMFDDAGTITLDNPYSLLRKKTINSIGHMINNDVIIGGKENT